MKAITKKINSRQERKIETKGTDVNESEMEIEKKCDSDCIIRKFYETGELMEEVSLVKYQLINSEEKKCDTSEVMELLKKGLGSKKYSFDSKPNGIVRKYYKSGEIEMEYSIVEGLMNGIVENYYKSGEMESECYFIDGKPNGFFRKYYKSGNLALDFVCKDDQYISGDIYFEDGDKSRLNDMVLKVYNEEDVDDVDIFEDHIVLIKGDKKIERYYYESGELKEEIPFVGEKINGIARRYYRSGNPIQEVIWENGLAISGQLSCGFGRMRNLTNKEIQELNRDVSGEEEFALEKAA